MTGCINIHPAGKRDRTMEKDGREIMDRALPLPTAQGQSLDGCRNYITDTKDKRRTNKWIMKMK